MVDNNAVGKLIRTKRKELGLTQLELGKILGVKKQTVTRYEQGLIKNLKRSTIAKLAELFEISPTVFLGVEPDAYSVPVIGEIACGEPILATENIIDTSLVDKWRRVDFALKCKGDSMINARIFDGDIVYIRQQADVENGEIAAVLIDNEATLKRVYKYPNRIELRPENPTYPILNYEGDQLNDIRILGKAILFSSEIR